jgi:type IX secretion system PorP/SprF family membrane protein
MRKRIIYISFFITAMFFGKDSYAQQDIVFSQFFELPMLRNPALAGIFNGKARITSAYRNQWESVTEPYKTVAVGAEFKVLRGFAEGDLMTFGLQVTNDKAGDSKLQRTQVMPAINYHKLLNEEKSTLLSLAFMGGLVSENFDPTALKFDDQFVNGSYSISNRTNQTFTKTSFNYFDVSTGLSLSSALNDKMKMYIGASLFHFNKPELTFIKDKSLTLNKKWGYNAGFAYQINNRSRAFFYGDHFRQGENRNTQLGFLYTLRFMQPESEDENVLSVSAGAVVRLGDAFIPVAKVSNNKFVLGVSYDANISRLTKASNFRGGFEMTLSFIDIWSRDDSEAEKTKCPTNIW